MKKKLFFILNRAFREASKSSCKLAMLSKKQFRQFNSYIYVLERKAKTIEEKALISDCQKVPEIASDRIFFDYELSMLCQMVTR